MLKVKVDIPKHGKVEIEFNDEVMHSLAEACQSLIQPIAISWGTLLSFFPETINRKLTPKILENEAAKLQRDLYKEFRAKVLETFKTIPATVLIEPKLSFILSAQNALPNVLINEGLQKMFSTLFINAMQKDKAVFASDIFMEMLKTMTHQDALLIIEGQYLEEPRPLIRIFECDTLGAEDEEMTAAGMPGFYSAPLKIPVFSHYALSLPKCLEEEHTICFSIHNLRRHELINVDYYEKIIRANDYKQLYEQLVNSVFYIERKQNAQNKGVKLCLTRGYTSPTDLGRSFFNACC